MVRKPVFSAEDLAGEAEEMLERVRGHEIRWIGRTGCNDGSVLEVEREARVHPHGVKVEQRQHGPVLHFREVEGGGDSRPQQYRSVRLADIYDIRR